MGACLGNANSVMNNPTVMRSIKKIRGANLNLQRDDIPDEFMNQAAEAVPGTVIVYSGCEDKQTSADVHDVSSFGLPPVSAAQKAGGACTNGLLMTLDQNPHISHGELIVGMQKTLQKKGYTQIPQLSTSRQMELMTTPFSVKNPNGNGRTRALLIGINYVGQQGELNGCVNDVKMMENYIISQGYSNSPQDMRILVDTDTFGTGSPTKQNIIEGIKWLVAGAQAGDSLFIHYSGHGTSVPDKSHDEEDGKDEALVPLDYRSSGVIIDDDLLTMLAAPLPRGAQLVGLFDCCHSGTILDLPFIFSGTAENVAKLEEGKVNSMGVNDGFSFANAAKLLSGLLEDEEQRKQLMSMAQYAFKTFA